MPADAVSGRTRPGRTGAWEVVFGDGTWRPVTVHGWREDRLGRQVVDVEWHAQLGTWAEAYLADRKRMRRPRER